MILRPARHFPQRILSPAAAVFLIALAMSALWDVLFYRHPAGWTLGAFPLLAGAILRLRPASPEGRSAMNAPFLFLAAVCVTAVWRSSRLTLPLALPALLALSVARTSGPVRDILDLMSCGLHLLRRGWRLPFRDVRLLGRRAHGGRLAIRGARMVAGWTIPIAGAALFLLLFSIANPVIRHGCLAWIRPLAEWLDRLRLPLPGRVFAWGFFATASWVLLRIRWRRRIAGAGENTRALSAAIDAPPAPAKMARRSLAVFNLVFLAQNLTDLAYLWGGATLPDGFTFAAYAHRGAYPLVVTALLAAAFMLALVRPGRLAEHDRAVHGLVWAWIAQNVFLTASAALRLRLYVGVYSLTRLRLAAAIWMGLVAFGLLAIGIRIARRHDNRWLLNVNGAALLAVLAGCAAWNSDGAIADFNVRHCREAGGPGPALDMAYLERLGPDTLPALRRYHFLPGAAKRRLEAIRMIFRLRDRLADRLRDWRGWTWSESRLARPDELPTPFATMDTRP